MGELLADLWLVAKAFVPLMLASMVVTAAGVFLLGWVGFLPGMPDEYRFPYPFKGDDDD